MIRNLRHAAAAGAGGHPLTFAAMDAASSSESGSSVGRLLSGRILPDDDDDAAEWSRMMPLASSATAPSGRRPRRRRGSARTATPSSRGRRRRRSGDRRPGDDGDDGDGEWNARAAGAAMMANSKAMDAAARRDAFPGVFTQVMMFDSTASARSPQPGEDRQKAYSV